MAFLLNFGPVKKQVIQCFTFLDQLVIINQKGEIYVEKINLLLSNQYLLCDKKNDRKFKSRDVCFLEDASPRVCTKDVLEIPLKNQDTDLEINQSDFSDIQITSPLRLPQHILEEDAESEDSSAKIRLKFSTESAY